MGLFGDEFDIVIEQPKVKELVKKVKKVKIDDKDKPIEKVLKSKKLTIQERLSIIAENVYKILGKQKENTIVIKERQSFDKYIDEAIKVGRIAIDTETNNSLDPVTCKIAGLCLHVPGQKQAYIPVNHRDPETKVRLDWQMTEDDCEQELQRIIDAKTFIVMHNGKFDYEVLKCACNIMVRPNWDTLVAAKLLNENEPVGLKWQYIHKIDPTQEKYDIEGLFKDVSYLDVDPEVFALYAASDSRMTNALYELQEPEFDKPDFGPHLDCLGLNEVKGLKWLFLNVEMPIVTVTAEMELRGVAIDEDFGKQLKEKYSVQLDETDSKIAKSLKKLAPIVAKWRLTKEANEKTIVYPPKKTKKTQEQIEAQFTLIDKDGNRYKLGKTKSEQLSEEINLGSPVQLAILFFDILGVPNPNKDKSRKTGKDSLELIRKKLSEYLSEEDLEVDIEDENVEEDDRDENIEEIESIRRHDITRELDVRYQVAASLCSDILKMRGLSKLISTYIDVIPTLAAHWPDHRLRFHLNAMGTETGRYSSGGKICYMTDNDEKVTVSGVNSQNIPSHGTAAELRLLFKAKEEKHEVELSNDYYEVPECDEVETASGWKSVKDLSIGDTIVGNESQDIISKIEIDDKIYKLFVVNN